MAAGDARRGARPTELVRRTRSMGIKVAIGFGQTEASPYVTHTLPDDSYPEWVMTVGWPMAQTEIKIIDPETGETVPLGAIGEICARGYSVMKDYFDNPEATREVLDADGWLRTGDLGSLDEHGYCRVQGRQKDMIIRGGEKFIPRDRGRAPRSRIGFGGIRRWCSGQGLGRGTRRFRAGQSRRGDRRT